MGCCFTSQEDPAEATERAANAAIEELQKKDEAADRKVKKLLLLGAGESGKSTLFKQCRKLYGGGYDENEFKNYRKHIHFNVTSSCKELVLRSSTYGPMDPSLDDAKAEVKAWSKVQMYNLDPQMATAVKRIWADPGIQETYKARANFQLIDSVKYFFEQVDNLARPEYIPDYEDILHVRSRTSGIIQEDFKINGQLFKMFDVGGQQNERRKWIECFDAVSSLLWVCAMSSYDQTLFEDNVTNRVHESLNLFQETVNRECFEDIPIILFLNKLDIFEVKITKVPLTVCFPEYTGDNSFDSAVAHFKEQFQRRLNSSEQKIYYHVTCATNSDQMLLVFKTVKDIVIRQALEAVGFYNL